MGVLGKEYYKWYTGEDGFVEILQVFVYVAALFSMLKTPFMSLFLRRIYRNFFPDPKGFEFFAAEFNEVMELVFAVGIMLFAVHVAKQETTLSQKVGPS